MLLFSRGASLGSIKFTIDLTSHVYFIVYLELCSLCFTVNLKCEIELLVLYNSVDSVMAKDKEQEQERNMIT